MLEPCNLSLDRLMLPPQSSQAEVQLLILQSKASHFPNQITNNPDQFRGRQTFKRIRTGRSHTQLESYFPALDPPNARKSAPVTGHLTYRTEYSLTFASRASLSFPVLAACPEPSAQ